MAMTPQEAASKGLAWVPDNHPLYGTKGYVGYQDGEDAAPTAPIPTAGTPPPIGGPEKIAGPGVDTSAPQTFNDPSGRVTSIPPPVAPQGGPEKMAGPTLGPLVDNGGTATHLPPPVSAPGPMISEPAPVPSGPIPIDTVTQPTAEQPTARSAFWDALQKMLSDTKAPSLDDPALKAQSEAFSLGQSRNRDRARAALAERMSQSGGPGIDSGAFESELQNLYEQQGENEANYNANLVGDSLKAQQQKILSTLAIAGNTLSAEDSRALTEKLANLDAQIKRESMAQAGQEFAQQYGLEGQKLAETIRQFDTNTDMGRQQLKQALDIFKQQMAEQGRQFDVDAALKKLGIDQQGALGQADIGLRDKLGSGNLMLGLLQALIGNGNFKDDLSARLGMFNTSNQNNWLQALLGALG